MTPIALWVPSSASIAEAARVLADGRMHAIPVADDGGRVVGILSTLDIVAWVAGGKRV
jgi:CBS domain-containing protein